MTKKLEQTWRWYGPADTVSLQDIKQAGATGIVTALHHIPHGAVWPLEDILERKGLIEDAGLTWSVVESVPVHEAIKTRRSDAQHYLENYRQSLRNLALGGIKTVCYNFMPVLDWTRTQLDLEMKDGSKALYFNWNDLAAFDLFILKREGAEEDYPEEIKVEAKKRHQAYTPQAIELLNTNILMGIPGERSIELEELRESIREYAAIGFDGLRQNLIWFLSSIAEVCEEHGIRMTIHPDDPPYPILGLPRIASNKEDLLHILHGVDKPFNGICFCTGSLGAGVSNDLPAIFEAVKDRVYFVHLRNVKKDIQGNFFEADHLDGDVDMYAVMKALVAENQLREDAIPFRPDHGHQMLDDLNKTTAPGYSAIGRLRGLAELRGLELGIIRQ
ncbi:mannonate dehydratase [Parapedobacter pyrenivorans]|uniref:Mannonate dehydratase n=1 Tax=Parapedobacter pyrenivorans TaxID=1305674 RepID=A0A917HGS1_9SPHI|nr:mannonate dehydratase [Parapedobacter pyrenivorans]GGG78708.1 mannonate dehydratase [Parapedobacter pyrenivorans]